MGFDDYPKPALAVDPAILSVQDGRVQVLLWRRELPPHARRWALPGVFVNIGEGLEQAVARACRTKAHLRSDPYIEQLFTWDKPSRDERGWVVVVSYFALTTPDALLDAVHGRDDLCLADVSMPSETSSQAAVVRLSDGRRLSLAFDHEEILGLVLRRLRGKLEYTTIAFEVLPESFTLRQLQTVYETLLGRTLNKDSFRRSVTQSSRLVEGTGVLQADVGHRPAELYRLARHLRDT